MGSAGVVEDETMEAKALVAADAEGVTDAPKVGVVLDEELPSEKGDVNAAGTADESFGAAGGAKENEEDAVDPNPAKPANLGAAGD